MPKINKRQHGPKLYAKVKLRMNDNSKSIPPLNTKHQLINASIVAATEPPSTPPNGQGVDPPTTTKLNLEKCPQTPNPTTRTRILNDERII
uniref:Uncharacterized protein n=1 Tax=Cannabis sativa TaxID=3483 RepID=A0A803NKQ6_CANSA